MMMRRRIATGFALAATACAAAARGIAVNGVALPDGTYSYALSPQGSTVRAAGKITLLGDSVSVENERVCPTSYNPDGHGMAINCNGYTIKVANYDGKWMMSYTLDGYKTQETRSCADSKPNRAGGFDCVRWEVDKIESPTTTTAPLLLYVIDTTHASKSKTTP